ncbi:long-chain acyl-CoA synthetase [Arthrobacter sp. B3I9]|uniref:AMP-binding protein n=1 Tax=Arthrobacter sp. B3I9 TaxID=3042270 RepID=UPI002793B21B|nr:AMP-binding protein [Arthrobacter sp. B3I9]MDQ0850296.1 long-chain acyl-CoA synthetase [Arthrobacter sp. B3I9]
MPFLDRLQRWADERPDGTAVVVAEKRLSWAEFRDAAGLVPVVPAVTVLPADNSLASAVGFAAAVAGERLCAVLDPSWPQQLLDTIAARITAKFPPDPSAVPRPGGRRIDGVTDGLTDGPPGSPFLIGLTAGTTSIPKAFTRSRESWRTSFDASIEFFGLTAEDVTLAPGPLAASLNLYALAECLYAGSEFHTLKQFDVGDAHAAVSHDGITRLVLVPSMLRLLSERGLAGGVDAAGIRSIVCAGSKLDARTLEAARRWAPNATIFEYYGASELSFVAGAGLPPGQQPQLGGTGIGRPFPGVQIRILDAAGAELPEGGVGNICVRSGMVSDGYLWGDDGQALQSLGGWYTVGDQGYLSAGTLHLLGRRSDMIITAGTNVYPHEVELALASVPGVASAVAAGLADDLRGQRVVAGVVPSHGGVTATQLRAGVEEVLVRTKRPMEYFALTELPLTDRGKLSRQLLADWITRADPRVRRLG